MVRTVSTEDSGTTVRLKVGELLRVELGRDYRRPTALPGGVVERTSAMGGYPTGRDLVVTYRAVASGSVDIQSSTDYACLHSSPPCARPQQQWSVHVIVKR